jgi:hypothetical protein
MLTHTFITILDQHMFLGITLFDREATTFLSLGMNNREWVVLSLVTVGDTGIHFFEIEFTLGSITDWFRADDNFES